MKIYVISLESDKERKVALLKRFPKNYSEFIFINAVDGRKLTSVEYFNVIKPNLYENNRLLSPAEVGCALSHIKVLEMIVENNEPAIIFEDDVIGDDEHLEIAKTISNIIADNEVIFLGGYEHIKEVNKIYLYPSRSEKLTKTIYEVEKNSYMFLGSNCCFAIGVDAAKGILKSQKNTLKLADSWYKFSLQTNIKFKFIQLFRHPALNTLEAKNSNIELQRKSVNYKKTYVLFWGSILLKIKLQLNSIKSAFRKKLTLLTN